MIGFTMIDKSDAFLRLTVDITTAKTLDALAASVDCIPAVCAGDVSAAGYLHLKANQRLEILVERERLGMD